MAWAHRAPIDHPGEQRQRGQLLDQVHRRCWWRFGLGLDPVTICQFVASGLLGPAAYQGGLAAAGLGLLVHCLVALGAAAAFVLAVRALPLLLRAAVPFGLAHGLAVWVVMNQVVIPLSRIPPSPTSLPLLWNGLIGHALLVGLPIALVARRELSRVPAVAAADPIVAQGQR